MRLIDADVLRQDMYKACFDDDYYFKKEMQKWDSGNWIRYKVFEEILAKQPSVEKIGKWIEKDRHLYCSRCGEQAYGKEDWQWLYFTEIDSQYCPNCGAKMVNEDETN